MHWDLGFRLQPYISEMLPRNTQMPQPELRSPKRGPHDKATAHRGKGSHPPSVQNCTAKDSKACRGIQIVDLYVQANSLIQTVTRGIVSFVGYCTDLTNACLCYIDLGSQEDSNKNHIGGNITENDSSGSRNKKQQNGGHIVKMFQTLAANKDDRMIQQLHPRVSVACALEETSET